MTACLLMKRCLRLNLKKNDLKYDFVNLLWSLFVMWFISLRVTCMKALSFIHLYLGHFPQFDMFRMIFLTIILQENHFENTTHIIYGNIAFIFKKYFIFVKNCFCLFFFCRRDVESGHVKRQSYKINLNFWKYQVCLELPKFK